MPRDALGRVTLQDVPGAPEDVYFAYDNQGRLLSALFNNTAGNGVTQTYDGLGRMDARTVFGRQLSYQYDLQGRRTRLTHPDGFYVTYGYSNVDELLTLTDSAGTTVATYGFDGLGFRTGVTRPNGASTIFVPDAAGRLQQLTQDLSGTGFDLTETFTYNPAGQITSKTVSNDSAYTFVPSPLNSTTTAQFDGQNQLTNFAGAAVADDANANVWTGLGSVAYTYDAVGQLRQASGTLVDYDPMGMLRRVQVGSTVKEYLYDGADLIAEYNGSGTVPVTRFVHGASQDEPLVSYAGSGTANKSWLHADERGSIVAASNGSGATASSVKYSADGSSATLTSSFGYTGQLYLPELQLYYYKARMYSAQAGRFVQPDPIGYADGTNLYGYVGNDAINRRDPSGLCDEWLILPYTKFGSSRRAEDGGKRYFSYVDYEVECLDPDSPAPSSTPESGAPASGPADSPQACVPVRLGSAKLGYGAQLGFAASVGEVGIDGDINFYSKSQTTGEFFSRTEQSFGGGVSIGFLGIGVESSRSVRNMIVNGKYVDGSVFDALWDGPNLIVGLDSRLPGTSLDVSAPDDDLILAGGVKVVFGMELGLNLSEGARRLFNIDRCQ